MVEAPRHPNALEMASKLDIDTLTNSMVRKKLGLSITRDGTTAKAFKTRDIPDPFFRDITKFMLKVGCVHLNAYGMLKQNAGVILSTYEGTDVD